MCHNRQYYVFWTLGRRSGRLFLYCFEAFDLLGRLRIVHQLADGIEDNFEMLIIFAFQCVDLPGKGFNRQSHATKFDEGGGLKGGTSRQ